MSGLGEDERRSLACGGDPAGDAEELQRVLRGIIAYAAAHSASNPFHPFHRAWATRLRAARLVLQRVQTARVQSDVAPESASPVALLPQPGG